MTDQSIDAAAVAGALPDARGALHLVRDGPHPAADRADTAPGLGAHRAPLLRGVDGRAPGAWPAERRPPAGPPTRSGRLAAPAGLDGLDGLLAPFDPLLAPGDASPRRVALLSALNGVLGDHLLRSGNPLAIPMQLRCHGRPLDRAALGHPAPGRALLLVHGLCQGDLGWRRNGHDFGDLLGRALAAAPVYAWYNSGRRIADNGLALAEALERMLADWPVPLQRLAILGHCMGGLVARSALAQGEAAGHRWPARVDQLVFIGTPHHGAPIERAGNWLHRVMDLGPHAAPFNRLSRLRSDGITDLRHGHLMPDDGQGVRRFHPAERRTPLPLPAHVQAHAIASTAGGPGTAGSLLGDGLVPVDSALGRHKRRAFDLALPESRLWVGHGIGHLDLLGDPVVYRRLLGWLG